MAGLARAIELAYQFQHFLDSRDYLLPAWSADFDSDARARISWLTARAVSEFLSKTASSLEGYLPPIAVNDPERPLGRPRRRNRAATAADLAPADPSPRPTTPTPTAPTTSQEAPVVQRTQQFRDIHQSVSAPRQLFRPTGSVEERQYLHQTFSPPPRQEQAIPAVPAMGDNTGQQPLGAEDIRRLIAEGIHTALQTTLNDPSFRSQLRGPPGEQGRQGEPGQLAQSDTTWKAADIGFFDPGMKNKDGILTSGTTTYFSDVYVFIDRMKDLVNLKSEEVVRTNIHSCLRGDAIRWYTHELSTREKEMMQSCPIASGWFASLLERFKPDRTDALAALEKEKYDWRDVRSGRTPRDYAQNMLRLLKDTGYSDPFDQLLKIRENIEPSLRRDLQVPTKDTTIAEFMSAIDTHYRDWKAQAARRERISTERSHERPAARFQRTQATQSRSNSYQDRREQPDRRENQLSRLPFRPRPQFSPPPRQPPFQRPYRPFPQFQQNSYQQNQYRFPQSSQPSYLPQRPANQDRGIAPSSSVSSRPPVNPGQRLIADRPFYPQHANQAYQPRYPSSRGAYSQYRQRPAARAYQADVSYDEEYSYVGDDSEAYHGATEEEDFYDELDDELDAGAHADSAYTDDTDAYYADHDAASFSSLPPPPLPASRQPEADETTVAQACTPEFTVTCLNCLDAFESGNELHKHLPDCQPVAAATLERVAVANFVDYPGIAIVDSNRRPNHIPGYAFRSWRYATVAVGLGSIDKLVTCCLDTGCVMTLIDSELARKLDTTVRRISPIPVSGIGSQHVSNAYIQIDLYFAGNRPSTAEQAIAKVPIEAHLVDNLKAQLLIGIDVLGPEGFAIDFASRFVCIDSCDGISFPIGIYAKPDHHSRPRPVYASEKTVIQPGQAVRLPVFVKSKLPERNFVFDPESKYDSPTQLVDANFCLIPVRNLSDKPQTIQRKARIGMLSEADYTSAYLVQPEAAAFCMKPPLLPASTSSTSSDDPSNKLTAAAVAQIIRPNNETKQVTLPNGITIYGDKETTAKLREVVEAYPRIWKDPEFVDVPPEQWMRIKVIPGKLFPRTRTYKQGPDAQACIDKVFDQLHDQGKMSWTDRHTPSALPVFVVWKYVTRNGVQSRVGRPVIDCRDINDILEADLYPLPLQEDVIQLTKDKRFITAVDAAKFFYQWRVHPDDIPYQAVVSHRGQELLHVVTMGNKNSVAYVQRQMDNLLREFRAWCRAYVDDTFAADDTLEDHIAHLHQLFSLFDRPEKLHAITSLEFPRTCKQLETYLGMTGEFRHYIQSYAQKSGPLQLRKTALLRGSPTKGGERKQWSRQATLAQPTDAEIQSFKTLQDEFKNPKWLVHFSRDRQLYIDLDASKEEGAGFGAMVYHLDPAYEHTEYAKPPAVTKKQPVLFLSRLLSQAETRYWPTELEVACLVWVLKKTRHLIEAAPIDLPPIIYTDNAGTAAIGRATKLNSTAVEKLNLRLIRASQFIQQFRLLLHHRPGVSNRVADALSRLPSRDPGQPRQDDDLDKLEAPCAFPAEPESEAGPSRWYHGPSRTPSPVDQHDADIEPYNADAELHDADIENLELARPATDSPFASETLLSDEFKARLREAYATDSRWSSILEQLNHEQDSGDPVRAVLPYTVNDGIIYFTRYDRTKAVCLPRSMTQEIFTLVHDEQFHQGFDAGWQKLLDSGLLFYRGAKLLKEYISHCPECRNNAMPRHPPYGALQPIRNPPIPFHTITIDFIVGMPESRDHSYNCLMTATDKFTKLISLIPGRETWTAEQWADALLMTLWTSNWGLPTVIISDRDPKFVRGLWKGFWTKVKTTLYFSTAYHPQTDGQSERTNQTVEAAARHWVAMHPERIAEWPDMLPALQMALNSSRKRSTGYSPHMLLYGMELRQPWTLARQATDGRDNALAAKLDAEHSLAFAAMKMKLYYDTHHKAIHFRVGDWVYIKLGAGYDIVANRQNIPRKLAQRYVGRFQIRERVGKLAYRLNLPLHWGIHPVISVAHLEAAPQGEDPWARRPADTHEPTFDARFPDETRYDVDRILAKQIRKAPGRPRRDGTVTYRTYYLVRWAGQSAKEDCWITADEAVGAEDLIQEFEDSQ
ncbi:hypothetical protein N7462_008253 [Penicillium macrosclerotiorum]|uniref:uncharacterized protein n=1 Tax=Penicillium macrosclerotiorum TaxID=303699 RepID=UPI0025473598|nr:uncharacterized protein N7462_008253 [Penicillium macrosclerotiorum]KAJ5675356.1 hypothetical protein N7462_008253 [Penicillium macrosclerotiorum]